MSNIILRERALTLRKQNKSYSQIKHELGVPKSTLSYWLRNYPLTKARIKELRGNNEARIERFRQTMHKKRQSRLDLIYSTEKNKILPLTKKELHIAGLALYWGEGSKADLYKVALSNTDPLVLSFFIYWLKSIYKIKTGQLRVALQLYSDMERNDEIKFWSKKLKVPTKQFIKPYIKITKSDRINHKGSFGHGTCVVMIYSVELKEKIMMQLKSLSEIPKMRL